MTARADSRTPEAPDERRALRFRRAIPWVLALVLPLGVLAILRITPELDRRWESHPAHFWLVLAASAMAAVLGYSVAMAARRRLDARLFLVSLAFIASAGFLGLHALATPDVLLGPNPGFELATPVGLVIGGGFVALSALELSPTISRSIIHRSRWLLAGLLGVMAVWAALSLAELPPLDDPLSDEELNGSQISVGVVGVLLYAFGSLGYLRLYRRRRARFVFAVTLAFALLAAAMIVIAFAENWRVSWWEWHLLMLAAFALIAHAAQQEWHEERFSTLYLDETLAGVKEASVLFADLQGFTAYSERAGPSAVAAMLNAYFSRLAPLMAKLGGDVHQLIGDAIMVVFNKEGNQPDHALVAARAGLALQETAASIARDHPEWPRFRVGINSGEVLAGVLGGERGHRKHGLVGDTVNLAARLESEAPVGEVVIGEGTYERMGAGALVERLPAIRVKGKEAPVTAYILRQVPPPDT